jgi:hypothetical protein
MNDRPAVKSPENPGFKPKSQGSHGQTASAQPCVRSRRLGPRMLCPCGLGEAWQGAGRRDERRGASHPPGPPSRLRLRGSLA